MKARPGLSAGSGPRSDPAVKGKRPVGTAVRGGDGRFETLPPSQGGFFPERPRPPVKARGPDLSHRGISQFPRLNQEGHLMKNTGKVFKNILNMIIRCSPKADSLNRQTQFPNRMGHGKRSLTGL